MDIVNYLTGILNWELVSNLLNSNFTAALAGAFAGAIAAQKISNRSKYSENLLLEIRATNAAIMSSFTVCNASLGFKEQIVEQMYQNYTITRNELITHQNLVESGEIKEKTDFRYHLDLRALQIPLMPIDILRSNVYENITSQARISAAVGQLSGAINSLSNTIEFRNELISELQEIPKEAEIQTRALYFGFRYGDGHLDSSFYDTINTLHNHTDDLIFFSDLLQKDLVKHGNSILKKYKKYEKRTNEVIHELEVIDLYRELIPDENQYKDWFNLF